MTIISECAELTVTIWEEIIGQCDQKLRKRSGLKVGFVYHNLAVNVLTFKIQFYKFLSYVNRYHHPYHLLFFPFFFLSFFLLWFATFHFTDITEFENITFSPLLFRKNKSSFLCLFVNIPTIP